MPLIKTRPKIQGEGSACLRPLESSPVLFFCSEGVGEDLGGVSTRRFVDSGEQDLI